MSTYEDRLNALREQLKADRLDGFVVPICDEHMSEYVGAYAQRLAWLTGFGGSAGTAVVLPEEAAIFIDGRYTLQVREQVDGKHWQYQSVPKTSVAAWLKDHAASGARIGYDPWVHTRTWVDAATKALADKGAELVAVERNPLDAVWTDQPAPSSAKMAVHPDAFAGQSSAEKRANVADWLTEKGLDATIISALDSVAWLLNVRGSDVDRTPVALSFAVVGQDGTADLYVAPEKLQSFRAATGKLKDLSFDTISGAGPNGAVVHYRVSEESSRALEPSSIYLVDSGGQYLDGTTDVTRTVWVGPGEPTAEMKDRFTRVLKGHIALARAVFPVGTRGTQLDTLARQFLWAAGVDYAHGTGHGVGSFLSVHEGPQRIATSSGGQAGTEEPLAAGMFLSNEPGYYKSGEFGIRIENLILVERREIEGAEGEYLGFETLTYAPIDRALVDTDLMTRDELRWWDEYHAKVFEIVGPQMEGNAKAWVEAACAPLERC